jgi:hypothetical protein
MSIGKGLGAREGIEILTEFDLKNRKWSHFQIRKLQGSLNVALLAQSRDFWRRPPYLHCNRRRLCSRVYCLRHQQDLPKRYLLLLPSCMTNSSRVKSDSNLQQLRPSIQFISSRDALVSISDIYTTPKTLTSKERS